MISMCNSQAAAYSALGAMPTGWVGEILDEELVASPRPSDIQARAAFMLGVELGEHLAPRRSGAGRWCLLRAPELRLGRDVLVPDLAGWRAERLAEAAVPEEPFLRLAPDWVCEVLGPDSVALDRTRKLPIYARAGVSQVWLVDPIARTLECFQRVKRGWLLVSTHEGSAIVRAEPFCGLALELSALWWPPAEPVLELVR
ncbi:Uma2 family endonuclease [Cystobacter fuscus]|nr:Uma2 family endonuclease [Cystobacter fuscus]